MIKFFLKVATIVAITGTAFLMTACDKENIDSEVVENFVNRSVFSMQGAGNCGKFGCFEFVFPLSIEFPDGSTQEVASYDELRATVKDWKENNADAEERPSLAFPLEVISEDGAIINVADKTELRTLAKECRKGYYGKGDWKGHGKKGMGGHGDRCFSLVFPVSINFPDGTSVAYDDVTSLKAGLRTWRSENGKTGEHPTLAFPITVELEDGTTQSMDSREGLRELKDTCSEGN